MLIVIATKTREVIAFLGEYNPHILESDDILSGTDQYGKQINEANASERFELIDALPIWDTLPLDDTGNLASYRKGYWLWVDGELVKNNAYVDPDKEAERKRLELEQKKSDEAIFEQWKKEQIATIKASTASKLSAEMKIMVAEAATIRNSIEAVNDEIAASSVSTTGETVSDAT